MKRTIQLSAIVMLVLALTFSVFMVAGASAMPVQGTFCQHAGLDTVAASSALSASPLPDLVGTGCLLPPGLATPDAGWHGGGG
jgi:hypothetical protein